MEREFFSVVNCFCHILNLLAVQSTPCITCSPNLAHQITWNWFVNMRGGAGNNIPCDLFNEKLNSLHKWDVKRNLRNGSE